MATDTIARPISSEEFLELERHAPEGIRLELVDGQVREYRDMTTRNPRHSESISRISYVFLDWLEHHPSKPGTVAGGEARCLLSTNPDEIVGLDIAYFEGEQHVNRPEDQAWFDGPPVLAVEVLSLSDTHENVTDRIRRLLRAGVKQVWIADPQFQTVTVHRTNAEPVLFSRQEEISGGADLPGLKSPVAKLFGR